MVIIQQIFILMLLTFSALTYANVESTSPPINLPVDLINMEEQIFIEPWLSFQTLSSLEGQYEAMSQHQKLWWLVRKAQCENLLYFYKEFEQTLVQAQTLVNNATPIEVQASINYFQGLSKQRSGGYVQSRQFFNNSMMLAEQGQFHHLYVKAKKELAYTHSLAELFETSLKDMQEAYVEAFALNDHFLIAMINETYGAIYGYMRENEKSLEYYEKALDTYEGLGYKAHIAEAIYGIASTYRYWKKYDLASEKFRLYQQKISYTPNTNITYFGAYGLGMTLAEQGSCDEAISVIEQAFHLDGLDDYDAELYKRKASCLIQLNRLDDAASALNNAREIFDGIPDLAGTAWIMEVEKIAGALAYAQQDYQAAYRILENYHESYSDFLVKNSSSRVATIRAGMELERKNVEKALTNQRARTQELELKAKEQQALQQSYFIMLLATLLIIALGVVAHQFINNRKMAESSVRDTLSGLFNRNYIFKHLAKQISVSSRTQQQVSILLLHIDNFKLINDSYGRSVGDNVIEQVAKLLKLSLRNNDTLGRIDGEEFLCILPELDSQQSYLIAQRMRNDIENHQFSIGSASPLIVTVSIGICELTKEHDANGIYSDADNALAQAKNSGINTVAIYKE